MAKSNVQTYPNTVKAAHRFEIVELVDAIVLAGRKFHFIGIGGVGMSGLAKVLLNNNAIVTGSDQMQSNVIDQLCRLGADIKIGHYQENINPNLEAVVISAAIKEDNPELHLARKLGCKVYKYAQMLGKMMERYKGIAVAGTHGKSTTSGWLSFVFKEAGLEPNFLVGADILQLTSSSGTGTGEYFIAEACEYDRSFLNLKPKIGTILNIEQDHLDYYHDEDDIVDAFVSFAQNIKKDGILVANGQDRNVAKVIGRIPEGLRCETFGLGEECNFSAQQICLEDGCYSFDVVRDGRLLGRTRIGLAGKHNILNALSVIAVSVNAGIEPKKVFEILPEFSGIDRRVMLKGNTKGITVLDDYAHHPTEIKASLEAIAQRYNPQRLWCVFQPHQYSRTRFLLDDFSESFKLADITIVPEIYFVRDTIESRQKINSQKLVERICANGAQALFIDGFDSICDYLKENVTTGDLVVTMGAGDIWKVSDEYIQWLRKDS